MNRKVDFWGGVCIALLAVCTACFSLIYVKSHHAVCFSLAITCGTFTYHTAMRFAVGWVVGRHRVPVNPQGRWFRPHSWEPGLYARLGVKRWKHRVPSYKPYDMHGDLQAVVMQMCRNELAHEVMAALSFVPLLFCLFCDDPVANLPVFLITSVLAAVADLIPVILQRYNRPRLQRLLRRRGKRAERKLKILRQTLFAVCRIFYFGNWSYHEPIIKKQKHFI